MADSGFTLETVFENLSKRLSALVYAKTDHDKIILNKTLDELNSLNYDVPFITNNDRAVLVINQCCYLIPSSETTFVSKALNLFQSLLAKQNVVVEGKTLCIAVTWCLDCLKKGDTNVIANALVVLQCLIKGNSTNIEELCDKVCSISLDLITQYRGENPPIIAHNALKCIEALSYTKEGASLSEALATKILKILFDHLYGEPIFDNNIWTCKCYITALSSLGNVADKWSESVNVALPEIIGVIKGYMLHGLPGQDNYKVEKVLPSNFALPGQLKPAPTPSKKVKGKYDKKSKKQNVTSFSAVEKEQSEDEEGSSSKTSGYIGYSESNLFQCPATTSDSDYSDGEAGFKSKLRGMECKVRQCALILLGTLLKRGDSKMLTRYLTSLLPDGSQTPHCRTLITCLLKEYSAKCRSEVLVVLSLILTKFKPYLYLADSISRSSFTTVPNNIGNIIKEMHRTLVLALLAENSTTVTTHVLKTISDLIRCSPYHRLEKGILLKLVKHVKAFITHKDVNVQICALTVFGCAASVTPQLEECRLIIHAHFSEESPPDVGAKPWLFRRCCDVLMNEMDSNLVLCIECLQVLCALVQNFFFDIVVCYPDEMFKIFNLGTSKSEYSIRLYTAKIMETMGVSLQSSLVCEDKSKRISLPLAAKIWNTIIPGPITTLIQSDDKSSLRSRGCQCIANIGLLSDGLQNSVIFDEISRANQIICISHLFGCAKDEAHPVRSTAVRALAVFVLFPSLRQDFLFFLDTVDAFFVAANDENQNVRAQASWLYGNLTEAAVDNEKEGLGENLDEAFLVKIIDAGVKLGKDNQKVKPNAVRGIGNILKIPSKEFIERNKDCIAAAIDILLKNASTGGFMKARWNSCYALANALSNPAVCAQARVKTLPVLTDLVQSYKNFKVRISAGFALAALTERADYGDYYIPTWAALQSALENAENIPDFNEYQRRDQLVDQICLTMCHLISLITLPDLIPLQDLLIHHLDPLQRHVQRFKDRIVPEKGNEILAADSRLGELLDDKALTKAHKEALTVLCGIFLTDHLY